MFFFFAFITGTGFIYTSASENIHRRFSVLPSTNYNANELWFKAATIVFPIFGAIILFALIALAIRILKTDNIHSSTSKLSGAPGNYASPTCGINGTNRKLQTNYDAYGAASTAINIGHTTAPNETNPSCQASTANQKPLLPSNNFDLKNEQFAQKNQLSSLEYHLLPQNCYDPAMKPNNLDISNNCSDGGNNLNVPNNLYRILVNLNYSPLQTNNNRTTGAFVDNKKNYEKHSIDPTNYWILNTNQDQFSDIRK